MKTCPFCAEEIQDEARKCRYCGSDLDSEAETPAEAPVQASGSLTSRAWVIVAMLALAAGGAATLHFRHQAQQAMQGEQEARQEVERARQEAQATTEPKRQESPARREDEMQAAPAEAQVDATPLEPRLLYKGRLLVPASSFREVLIGNAENYEEIFGKFEAPKDQTVTVLALNEAEFYRYRAGEKVDGQQWTNVAQEFSFAPDAASCFIVVQRKNASVPADVALEVYGRPRYEASRESPRR